VLAARVRSRKRYEGSRSFEVPSQRGTETVSRQPLYGNFAHGVAEASDVAPGNQ